MPGDVNVQILGLVPDIPGRVYPVLDMVVTRVARCITPVDVIVLSLAGLSAWQRVDLEFAADPQMGYCHYLCSMVEVEGYLV